MSSEQTLERAFVTWCAKRGIVCLKLRAPSRGWPDRTVLRPDGQAAFVELKVPGGVRAKHQEFWIHTLQEMGYRAGFAETLEEAIAIVGADL